MNKIVIIDAVRTPVGKYKGSLSNISATQLGVHAVEGLLNRNKGIDGKIEQVIFGNVLQAGNGQNIARQISIGSGLSEKVPASTINQVCGSGLKATILGKQLLELDEAQFVITGGVESMSTAPMLKRPDSQEEEWSVFSDGLHDAFSGQPMGITAENVAKQFNISRQEQDKFAQNSQEKALVAQKNGKFRNEIIPVGEFLEDETIREESSLEKLATLKTVFQDEGTVTAGNASSINDGASALLLSTEKFAKENEIDYLAEIMNSVEVGIAPEIMGMAPVDAVHQLIEKTGLKLSEIDLFEINEAFAASSVAVNHELGIDEDKVNVYGGAIALGHAIGSSGSRILITLAHALVQENKKYGIAAICTGGGQGLAMLLRNPKVK
ncbi:MAG: thiolase family protein [Streptococcaceae bacterium]|nr:thiolase family protein [Streptococcaceae bacterium]